MSSRETKNESYLLISSSQRSHTRPAGKQDPLLEITAILSSPRETGRRKQKRRHLSSKGKKIEKGKKKKKKRATASAFIISAVISTMAGEQRKPFPPVPASISYLN